MNATIIPDILSRSPGATIAMDVAIKATLVLAAAAVASLALRRSSAAARHLTWCSGLAAAVAMPVMTLALPGWSWRVLPAGADGGHPRPTATADSPAPLPAETIPSLHDLDESEFEMTDDAEAEPTAATPIAPPSPPSWHIPAPSWSWLWVAWLAGALAVLSTPMAGQIALRRLTRDAGPITAPDWTGLLRDLSARLHLTRRVALLRSPRAAMPMTWGGFRPVVLLPAEADSWSIDRRRAVLLHELAHVRRFDCLTQSIARAACALYWFNPLAWVAARRMRVERERACDDIVLLAGARASDYAVHLLEIARGLRAPRAAALAAMAMARPSQLEGRLLAILDPDRRRVGPGRKAAMMAMLGAIAVVLPLAMLRVGARASAAQGPIAGKPTGDDPPARMTVTGRVLDPSGKPVPDASVMVIVPSKLADRPTLNQFFGTTTTHEGRCDASGRFGIEVPRTTSARHDRLLVTAMATGYGIGWAELGPDADPPAADVSLRTEQVIRGRLFDVQGQPARGVALRVQGMIRDVPGVPARIIRPDVLERPWRDLAAWPGPAISDEQGRFTLRGIGRGPTYVLVIDDPRFGIQTAMLRTDDNANARPVAAVISQIQVEPGPDPKPIAIALEPARTVTGRVTFADTGRPVPRALIAFGVLQYQADDQGRFRVAAPAVGARLGRFNLRAQSPDGPPYLIAAKRGEWPKGSVEQSVDIALTRGVVVRGKITEEGTGRPIAGAVVSVTTGAPADRFSGRSAPAATGPDGTYRAAAPPGSGYVVVQGPDDDYVLREFGGNGRVLTDAPGRERVYAHAYRAVDLKPGGPDLEVDLALRRGAAIRGRVVGPDGQPVREAAVFSRVLLESTPAGGWKTWGSALGNHRVFDGRFALHGLDADAEVPAYFLEPGRKLGATARFSGRSAAAEPATVRLEPCGTARARLVGPDGKPLDRYPAGNLASMVVTPGPTYGRTAAKDGPLFADESPLFRIDPVHYGDDFQSDAQGLVTFPALIPGASYRLVDRTPIMDGGEPAIRKEFTVRPGEALDLGDILVAKPVRRN